MSTSNTDIISQALAAIDRFDAPAALALLQPLQGKDDSAAYLACLIEAQGKAKHFADAEASVASAVAKYPQDVAVLMAAGMAAAEARNYPLAQERYQRVTQVKPDHAPAYNNLGLVHEYLHDEDQARAAYAKTISLNPALIPPYRNLGRLDELAGRIEEARATYRQAQEHTGDDEFVQLLKGVGGNFSSPAAAAAKDAAAQTAEDFLAGEIGRAARRHLPSDRRLAVLDLICGTGIVGAALWDKAGSMIGVDPRVNELRQAQARNIYYDLKDQVPAQFLRTCKRAETDLITANSAFITDGNLLPIFLNLYAVLAPGGLLVTTFPTQIDQLGYYIEARGIFSHDPRYVLERADFEGMRLLERIDFTPQTHPVDRTYTLMVFTKPAA